MFLQLVLVNSSARKDMVVVVKIRGGARNFPTEALELPTGGLK